MKSIGIVDFYASEWHADHYPAWIAEENQKLGYDYAVKYVYAKKDVSPVTGLTTAQWAKEMGLTVCTDVAQLCERSDAVLILAPSNPEEHLALCKEVFPFGKPTFVDKTFAPDSETAREIFALGEKHHTPFFSSSALRYAQELDTLADVRQIHFTAGGSNLPEYIIHPLEMTVKVMGLGASYAKRVHVGTGDVCFIGYPDGRSAVIDYLPSQGYSFAALTDEGEVRGEITHAFFPAQMNRILRFFENGEKPFDNAETLEIMRLRDLLLAGAEDADTL